MELLQLIMFFNGLTLDPALNNSTVYDTMANRLKLFDNGCMQQEWTKGYGFDKDIVFEYSVNKTEVERTNLFRFTARYGYKTILKYLIENKATQYSITVRAATEIIQRDNMIAHLAVEGGHLDIVQYLIEMNGLNPMVEDFMETLLQTAVIYERDNIVKYLIEDQKVDVDATSGFRSPPLAMSAFKGNYKLFKYLIEKGANCSDGIFLYSAACGGNIDILRYLVEDKHQDLNVAAGRTFDKSTPLICACSNGHLSAVKYMVNHNADVEAAVDNTLHRKALYVAIEKGHLDIVKYLIGERNANTTFYVGFGFYVSALHVAVDYNKLDIVKYLVDEKNMSIYVENRRGRGREKGTPIHHCAKRGHLEIMKYFVEEKGADLSVTDSYGNTILLSALNEFNEVNFDLVKYLLSKGADVNAVDNDGDTVLHKAVHHSKLEYVKYFVEKENVSATKLNNFNRSVLHEAVIYYFRGHMLDIVAYLIEDRKLYVNAMDSNGDTPLHFACWALGGTHRSDSLDLVRYLVEHGANTSAENKKRETPVDVAQRNQRMDILNIFNEMYFLNVIED